MQTDHGRDRPYPIHRCQMSELHSDAGHTGCLIREVESGDGFPPCRAQVKTVIAFRVMSVTYLGFVIAYRTLFWENVRPQTSRAGTISCSEVFSKIGKPRESSASDLEPEESEFIESILLLRLVSFERARSDRSCPTLEGS